MIIKCKDGIVLPSVLLLFVVLFIIGAAAVGLSGSDNLSSINHMKKTQAYYLAKSGADAMGTYIVNLSKAETKTVTASKVNSIDDNWSELTAIPGVTKGNFKVYVDKESENYVDITSEGYVDNIKQTVTLRLEKSKKSLISEFDGALDVSGIDNSINVGGFIIGDVYYHNTDNTNFIADPESIFGNLFVPEGNPFLDESDPESLWFFNQTDPPADPTNPYTVGETYEMTNYLALPDFPDFPYDDLVSGDSHYFEGVYTDLESGYYVNGLTGDLVIDVGDDDIEIRTSSVDISGLTINKGVNDEGIVKIYVDGDVTFTGDINESGDENDIIFYIDAGGTFTPKANAIIRCNIYAYDADIDLGGNPEYFGNVITGGTNVKLHGTPDGTCQIIYAPFALVTVNGTADVYGSIIANRFRSTGEGAGITYLAPDAEDTDFLNDLFAKEIYSYYLWN